MSWFTDKLRKQEMLEPVISTPPKGGNSPGGTGGSEPGTPNTAPQDPNQEHSQIKWKPAPKPIDLSARVRGVDVAKYQPTMDAVEWEWLWNKGYRFAYAKCTDGWAGKDSFYQIHRRLSKQRGFLFGPYHFFRFGYEPKVQAAHFFKNAAPMIGELPPVLDVEWDRYTLDKKYGENKRMDDWAADKAFECLVEIEKLFGVKPIIYTNAYFWPEKVAKPERFLPYRCWIPAYANSLDAKNGDGVKVPYPWKKWDLWQDGEDLSVGDVKEIDTDWFRGTLEDLRTLARTK